ncbi:hypothetical protein JTB14_033301 [Gonioctena quinquepunctata]|nr:hypothetical protein JTB14_033301 [Gonioctena quinquepunctata]
MNVKTLVTIIFVIGIGQIPVGKSLQLLKKVFEKVENISQAVMTHYLSEASYTKEQLKLKYPGFGENFIFFPGQDGEMIYGYLISNDTVEGFPLKEDIIPLEIDIAGINLGTKHITFTLFSRDISQGLELKEIGDLKYYDNTKKLVMVTHGWMSSGKEETCVGIKNNYLNTTDINVIIMDWGDIAGNVIYPVVVVQVPNIAAHCTYFLTALMKTADVKHGNIQLIGHSLGAHALGFCARHLSDGKIAQISGLDPARPGFEVFHLNSTDANFVLVIHTDANLLGKREELGHADFYPNCGVSPQPGCENMLVADFCSHSKSWMLYEESIKNSIIAECSEMTVTQGDDVETTIDSQCADLIPTNCNRNQVPMGAATPPSTRGSFYVKTD